ncbi:uncharacterized protein [Arachis hypogaea]|uniref:uncharacterized protein n=1 Tax=Arachis hypogaea TaxID=3818 RepID=UPI000DECD1C4|nr:uncharacterized protein LOC112721281 [Arachis hypogaea]
MAWAIELSHYNIQYEPHHAINTQAIVDFSVEVVGISLETLNTRWKLHVYGASNQAFDRVGIILESLDEVTYEQFIKFEFSVSNNQTEYETMIGGLILAREVGVARLEVNSDSQVLTTQVIVQPRERNAKADLLSKLASTKLGAGNRSLIQGLVKDSSVALCSIQSQKEPPSWIDPIQQFLEKEDLPKNTKKSQDREKRGRKIYGGVRSAIQDRAQSTFAKMLAARTDGWPTVLTNANEYVKKCLRCQDKANFHKALAEELSSIMASRPFSQWGVDLLGPFPMASGQIKYLIVAIDYYTKWVEVEPLFGKFLSCLGIKQRFSSMEQPQRNRQAEAANKVILKGLKKYMEQRKGSWTDELASVLWSYKITLQSAIGDTPFWLTYGVDVIIPIEIGEPSLRLLLEKGDEASEKT